MTEPVSLAPHPLVDAHPAHGVGTYLAGAALMLRHAFQRASDDRDAEMVALISDVIVAFRPAVERAEAQQAGVRREG